jgi:hypothetical protein
MKALRMFFTMVLIDAIWSSDREPSDILEEFQVLANSIWRLKTLCAGAERLLPDVDYLHLQAITKQQLATQGVEPSVLSQKYTSELEIWIKNACSSDYTGWVDIPEFHNWTQTVSALEIHLSAVTSGRSLAWTSRGYMAMIPENARCGDRLALFSGGRMPYVIRSQQAGNWTFVGEAYVHGAMYGELWPEDEFGVDDIVLC